ncbi:NB-ARC domain-containing protein [Thermogemmatispora sp.]|uniref:NB-ARC domain-containing protein n=1 Tax=Thermogemmatispora sp. TaxID=1968838 RepID=UPI0035E4263E
MPANDRLRSERLRRGWSREYVAAQIGVADPKTIGRWERGDATPSAYFRQKLCSFFGLSAQELGLYQESAHAVAPASESFASATGQAVRESDHEQSEITRGILDPAMPLATPESLAPIGRDQLLAQLKAQLMREQSSNTVALYGLPGVGKTTLALAIVHDPEVQAHFHEGILWGRLGSEPDLPALLRHWAALLEIPPHIQLRLESLESWVQALRAAIHRRRMLFVIDDAWSYAEALLLMVGGPRCAYLLTTRLPVVALHFANERALRVPELEEDEALALLGRFAPLATRLEPEACRALVRAVGGLPLALTLMGRYLQAQTYSGHLRRLRTALGRLQNPLSRLSLEGCDATLEPQHYHAQAAPPSLAAALDASYRRLSREARQGLTHLATLPPKPQTFHERSLGSQVSLQTLDELLDAGLLESAGPDSYTLHPVVAEYARSHACLHNQGIRQSAATPVNGSASPIERPRVTSFGISDRLARCTDSRPMVYHEGERSQPPLPALQYQDHQQPAHADPLALSP